MIEKPNRVRVMLGPYQDCGDKDPTGYAGCAVLAGLPQTIRRRELQLNSTICKMEKRGDFPRRFNFTPHARCGILRSEAWLQQRRQISFAGQAEITPGPMFASARRAT